MKRTLSICILLLLALACVIIFLLSINYVFERGEHGAEDLAIETEEKGSEALESNLELDAYQYILVEEDGQIIVYKSDNTTLYLETGIRIEDLPEEERNRIESGIRFENEQELFDFLESYSS